MLRSTRGLNSSLPRLPSCPSRQTGSFTRGDVVNDPDPEAYELAAEVLGELKAPVYYATGNHDDAALLSAKMSLGSHTDLMPDQADRLVYRIESGRDAAPIDCFVIDGKVDEAEGPHGHISEDQLAALASAIDPDRAFALFLHYPLIPLDSAWIDQHLITRNGEAVLAAVKRAAGDKLLGVFCGHVHRDMQVFREGVMHSIVSSPACEFSAGPDDESCDFLPTANLPFHHISLSPDSVSVKAYHLAADAT